MVRAAVFNSLEARGLVEGARMVDLFAGSGALGIEAVSRGAAHVVLVERDRRAVAAIRENLTALGVAGAATLAAVDAAAWVAQGPEVHGRLDVALVDPPYRFDGWPGLLDGLAAWGAVTVVAESDGPLEAPGWDVLGVKRYGGTVVSQLRPRGAQHL